MKNFKINRKESKNKYTQLIEFYAVNSNNKEIYGADANIIRGKDDDSGKWEDWKLNYGSTGAKTYEEKLPYVQVIVEAMEELKKLNR